MHFARFCGFCSFCVSGFTLATISGVMCLYAVFLSIQIRNACSEYIWKYVFLTIPCNNIICALHHSQENIPETNKFRLKALRKKHDKVKLSQNIICRQTYYYCCRHHAINHIVIQWTIIVIVVARLFRVATASYSQFINPLLRHIVSILWFSRGVLLHLRALRQTCVKDWDAFRLWTR